MLSLRDIRDLAAHRLDETAMKGAIEAGQKAAEEKRQELQGAIGVVLSEEEMITYHSALQELFSKVLPQCLQDQNLSGLANHYQNARRTIDRAVYARERAAIYNAAIEAVIRYFIGPEKSYQPMTR